MTIKARRFETPAETAARDKAQRDWELQVLP